MGISEKRLNFSPINVPIVAALLAGVPYVELAATHVDVTRGDPHPHAG
jgi:hypothetical protein